MSSLLLRLTLLVALTPSAVALVDSITPTELTSGTVVTVTGLEVELGAKKPRVRLVPEDGKPRKLKVLEHTATSFTALLRKASPGSYAVEVKPKGGDAFTLTDAVDVRLPEVLAFAPETAQPGDEVDVFGRFFGDKKGRVTIAGRRGKVLAWEPGSVDGPEGATDRLRVRLSKNAKKTANGPHPARIRNRIGEGDGDDARLVITGGALATYRARLDGEVWNAVTNKQVGLPGWDPTGSGGMSMVGFSGKPAGKKTRTLTVAVAGFDPTTFAGELPLTVAGAPNVSFTYAVGTGPSASIWQGDLGLPLGDGDAAFVTITDVSGGVVTGFGESLQLVGLSGAAVGTTLDVTDFEFSIPMIPE